MKWLILKEPIAATLNCPPLCIGQGRVKQAHSPVIDAASAEARDVLLENYTVLWPYEFQLLDDDGQVYFEGKCGDVNDADQDAAFAPLDWASGYAGCTEMRVRKVGGSKWEAL
jgi:hypothetical protein